MTALLSTKERSLLVVLLVALGSGVLWVLVQNAPPVSGGLSASALERGEPESTPTAESRPAELPPVPELPQPRRGVLLVSPAGAARADLVLAADGSWSVPAASAAVATQPAASQPAAPASRPAGAGASQPGPVASPLPLVVSLPAPLGALDPRARASLVRCLEIARRGLPDGARVGLGPDADAGERAALEPLLRWVR